MTTATGKAPDTIPDKTSGTAPDGTRQSDPAGRVRIHVEGPVGWIVIDNEPRRNALTRAMWEAIPAAVAGLCANPQVRVIVLRGAGSETFVAGADISEFETVRRDAASARAYEAANVAAFDALREASLPTSPPARRWPTPVSRAPTSPKAAPPSWRSATRVSPAARTRGVWQLRSAALGIAGTLARRSHFVNRLLAA